MYMIDLFKTSVIRDSDKADDQFNMVLILSQS